MANIYDYNANVVTPITNGMNVNVPQTPAGVGLAETRVSIPNKTPNFVELKATIGVEATVSTGNILFRIFRDNVQIYYGLKSIGLTTEPYSLITLQAIDKNVAAGSYGYTLSIEKFTAGLTAKVIGPLNLDATVITL
ncbi:exosporium protein C [Paenibacillus sp. CMAA1364]